MRAHLAIVPLVPAIVLLGGCAEKNAADAAGQAAPSPVAEVTATGISEPVERLAPRPSASTGSAQPSTRPSPSPSRTATRPAQDAASPSPSRSATKPPADTRAPAVLRATADAAKVTIDGCNEQIPRSTTVHIYVDDPNTAENSLTLTVRYVIGQVTVTGATPRYVSGTEFRATFGPVPHDSGYGYVSDVTAVVTAVDPAGNSSGRVKLANLFQFGDCYNG